MQIFKPSHRSILTRAKRLYSKPKNKKKKNALARERIRNADSERGKPTSCIFFTTHKCASSFSTTFFKELIKNSQYRHVNYASAIWSLGDQVDAASQYEPFLESEYDRLYFLKGEIYAPQRKPIDFPGRTRFRHIFFLRDPRDVIVSAFYSFGSSHSPPKAKVARQQFEDRRTKIQESGIDGYAKDSAKDWLHLYQSYQKLRESAESSLYLSYDLFKDDTPQFLKSISDYLELKPSPETLQAIALKASPQQKQEDVTKHKRSGKSGQYAEKLQPETVSFLNDTFEETLTYWGFSNQS